ncbi:hypothetical protein [Streptosporangium sp. KLBMP 9127]|nr:hypothetical protein [Streptosporangium sp. KLBMP 9127]
MGANSNRSIARLSVSIVAGLIGVTGMVALTAGTSAADAAGPVVVVTPTATTDGNPWG